MLSERYGWTPDQIRDMKWDDVQAYIEIISIKRREEVRQIKKHGK